MSKPMMKGSAKGGLKENFGSIKRALGKLFEYYPRLAPLTMLCILFSSIVSSIPSLFVQNILSVVEKWYISGDWASAWIEIKPFIFLLITLYILSLASMFTYTQLMAYMTQGYLNKMRREMFDKMQDLPIRYFDTHQHGDIMSHYTNDIDTLRMLVSQSLPTFIQSGAIVLVVLSIMLYFSILMTMVLFVGVIAMFFVTKKFGGGSARNFMLMQRSVAKTEGFIQEMMNGQKVNKVFNHEEKSIDSYYQYYEDEEQNNIFVQMMIAEGQEIALDTEDAQVEKITVQGADAMLITENQGCQIIWGVPGQNVCVVVSTEGVSARDTLKFAESLKNE